MIDTTIFPATPKAPSPLIKTLRWGGLLLGFTYGWKHYYTLKARETEIRAQRKAHKEAMAPQLKKEAEEKLRVELNALAEQLGISNRV